MKYASEYFPALPVLLISLFTMLLVAHVSYENKKKHAAEEMERANRAKAKLHELIPEFSKLYNTISSLSSFDSGYLMKRDWDALLLSAAPALAAIAELPQEIVKASEYADTIAYVQERCQDTTYREKRNDEYKALEIKACDALFSDIDGGKSLDPQQRDAIVTDEYSNLVIAGAGSGKTSVVVGKVKYLV